MWFAHVDTVGVFEVPVGRAVVAEQHVAARVAFGLLGIDHVVAGATEANVVTVAEEDPVIATDVAIERVVRIIAGRRERLDQRLTRRGLERHRSVVTRSDVVAGVGAELERIVVDRVVRIWDVVDQVVAEAADGDIVAFASQERVVTTDELVGGGDRAQDRNLVGRAGIAIDVNEVPEGFAVVAEEHVDFVVAGGCLGVDPVIASAAECDVRSVGGEDEVIAADRRVGRADLGDERDRLFGVEEGLAAVADDDVLALVLAAGRDGLAVSADDNVAGHGVDFDVDGVVAEAGDHEVVADTDDDLVVATFARCGRADLAERLDLVVANKIPEGLAVVAEHDIGVVGDRICVRRSANSSVDGVVAVATEHNVRSAAGEDLVVATNVIGRGLGGGDQRDAGRGVEGRTTVVAEHDVWRRIGAVGTGVDGVVTEASDDRVGAFADGDVVVATISGCRRLDQAEHVVGDAGVWIGDVVEDDLAAVAKADVTTGASVDRVIAGTCDEDVVVLARDDLIGAADGRGQRDEVRDESVFEHDSGVVTNDDVLAVTSVEHVWVGISATGTTDEQVVGAFAVGHIGTAERIRAADGDVFAVGSGWIDGEATGAIARTTVADDRCGQRLKGCSRADERLGHRRAVSLGDDHGDFAGAGQIHVVGEFDGVAGSVHREGVVVGLGFVAIVDLDAVEEDLHDLDERTAVFGHVGVEFELAVLGVSVSADGLRANEALDAHVAVGVGHDDRDLGRTSERLGIEEVDAVVAALVWQQRIGVEDDFDVVGVDVDQFAVDEDLHRVGCRVGVASEEVVE